MKFNKKILLTILLVITSGLYLSACSSESPADLFEVEKMTISPETSSITEASEEESTSASEPKEEADHPVFEDQDVEVDETIPSNGLSIAEVEHLVFMREEEKLAQDVYLTLYDQWGLPLFENIARSESSHTEAVKGLLDKYGIPDPAEASPTGVFANADLQQLYDELTEGGKASLSAALKVGGAIEEIDILDLQSALEETTTADIQRVYENLLKGSENHLRAFTSTLSRQTGETYEPQYLSQDAYDAIVASDSAQGNGNGRGGGRRP